MTNPDKIKEIQDKLKNKRLNEKGFLNKLKNVAARIGRPAVQQLYALYFLMKSPNTSKRSKIMIVGALVYFLSPIDAIPDLLGPLGFSDDLAVISLVFTQLRSSMNTAILDEAKAATDKLLGSRRKKT